MPSLYDMKVLHIFLTQREFFFRQFGSSQVALSELKVQSDPDE